jgi:hypothetical protein
VAIVGSFYVITSHWRLFVSVHSADTKEANGLWTPRQPPPPPPPLLDDNHNYHNQASMNELTHRAFFGLGHRLHRSACSWHLARTLQHVTHLRFHWESCLGQNKLNDTASNFTTNDGTDYNVFRYLFGDDLWEVPISKNVRRSVQQQHPRIRRMIIVRNDVEGYIKGQLYKDLQLSIPSQPSAWGGSSSAIEDRKSYPYNYFVHKIQSDIDFYKRLVNNYRFNDQVIQYMAQYQFDKRLVIGLHLRLGNGESMHFQETGRGVHNEQQFVSNLISLIGSYLREHQSDRHHQRQEGQQTHQANLSPLLFLATDTAHWIPIIQNATMGQLNVETIVLPQIRLMAQEGVTYDALQGTGWKCLQGWQAMVSDMILLSQTNALIAAKYSTFTQSLPLSLIFARKQQFCEVSSTGHAMTCTSDMKNWLFRTEKDTIHTYFVDDTMMQRPKENEKKNETTEVTHMLTLLLPDIEPSQQFTRLLSFLKTPWEDPSKEPIFYYGRSKINKKYRYRKPSVESKWNVVEINEGNNNSLTSY